LIENVDGFLTCVKGAGFGAAPRGSYYGSCHGVFLRGDTMTASCRRGDGTYVESRIDLNGCSPLVVSNEEGILKCAGADGVVQPTQSQTSRTICAYESLPPGWIVFDVSDDTQCGESHNNNLSIVRFDQLPVGAALTVCTGAPTPAGWSVTRTFNDPLKCGGTDSRQSRSVQAIRRDR
jgi:hypothetical protein